MNILQVLVKLRDDIMDWVANNLRTKVDKVEGKGLSTNDFDNGYKNKLNNAASQTDLDTLKDELNESIVSESLEISDEDGNSIFKVDAEGAHTTKLTVGGKEVKPTGKIFQVAALTDISEELIHNDIAIVTATITEDKVTRTAFIWDETLNDGAGDWVAFDGNYSAANVYFDSDFTFTVPVGVVTQADIDNGSGSVDRSATGQNMQTFFSGLFAEITDPTITQPNLSVTLSKTSEINEVGNTYSIPTATARLYPGSYSYGTVDNVGDTDTGIVATKITITDDKVSGSNSASNSNTATYTISSTSLPESNRLITDAQQTIKYSATCSYPESTLQPINNIKGTTNAEGETYSPIAAGEDSASATFTITGYRKMFMGPVETTAELNSKIIRGISDSKGYVNTMESKTAQTFIAPPGTERIIVAFRKGYTEAEPKFEYYTMSWESFSGFTRLKNEDGTTDKTVSVSDARGDGYGQVAYIIYECTSNPLEAATQFRVTLN